MADLLPFTLNWGEAIACRTHDDLSEARDIGVACFAFGPEAFEGAVTERLVARFGRWATGWRWNDSGGGPVRAWCCSTHSMSTVVETADRVRAALAEWRDWILHLDRLFDGLAESRDGLAEDAAFARSAAAIVHEVVARTAAEDAWYHHCQLVLSWFLQHGGVEAPTADQRAERAISGRFASWVAPEPGQVLAVAADLAEHRDR